MLAARYATDFNAGFRSVEETGRLFEQVDAVCSEIGRDPRTLVHSAAEVVCIGRDDATVRRRAEAIGRDVDDLLENAIAGTFEQARDRFGRLTEVGMARAYLQVLDLADLDHLADLHEAFGGSA
jgi:alkanesulfonate monooxygenase SsuD/methylene tetrahydromethanopterin reductase-like flavin-dependent oxidoreductase (luciferase family)